MSPRRLLPVAVLALAGCGDSFITWGAESGYVPEGQVELSFAASDEDFLNPERGFYTIGSLVNGYDFTAGVEDGARVSYVLVRLDDYRGDPLDADFLATLDDGFALARAAGVKILLRFAYNFESGGEDAPRDVMLGHLAQLAPVLQDNVDVIAALQAGMIGEWGEWHSSSNGLDNPDDRRAIVEAQLAALPASRAIMLRSPMLKAENWPGPLDDDDAFSGEDAGRLGHHNDCFLASDTDVGTYAEPVEAWKDFVAQDGRFLPIGGETCRVAEPRSGCDSALAEMERLHWSMLALGGSEEVWAGWRDDGCDADMARRLGYRFRITRATASEAVAPGGVLGLSVELRNDGFASPYNPRPVRVVLEGNGVRLASAPLVGVDPRWWQSGEDATFGAALRVPADLAPGDYRLALWLPDAEATIEDDPAYAIRLANEDVWVAGDGTNTLATVAVDPAAPGPVDDGATEFAELSF